MAYEINPERKAIIHKIFSEYSKGKGVVLLTKELNQSGAATFKGKKKNSWQRSTIFGMLRNVGFIGIFNYKGEKINKAFPPAIPEKLFYQVQAILERNSAKHGNYSSDRVNNILRGISKCKHCGSTMNVTWDNYICCSGYHVGKCKVKNMIKYKSMEFEFAKWFVPKAKEVLLGKNDDGISLEALQAKQKALTNRIEATLDLMDTSSIPEIKTRLSKLESERNSVENEIANHKASQANLTNIPEKIAELERLTNGILDNQAIRKQVAGIIPSLIKRVEIDLASKSAPLMTVFPITGEPVVCEFLIKGFTASPNGKIKDFSGGYSISKDKEPRKTIQFEDILKALELAGC